MKQLIEEIKNVCSGYMGINITEEKAKEILNEYPTIKKFGANDTQERDNILNFICLDICNMKVPTYGDTKECKENFNNGIIKNAVSKGYTLRECWN